MTQDSITISGERIPEKMAIVWKWGHKDESL